MKHDDVHRRWPITELVPHRDTMLLIDTLLASTTDTVTVETTVREAWPFLREEGWPSWAGIELMAQAIAAYAGLEQRLKNEEPRLGFLVGTRRYQAHLPFFEVGAVLHVTAHSELVTEQGLAVFNCTIQDTGGAVCASANVNVFQPPDVEQYLLKGTS